MRNGNRRASKVLETISTAAMDSATCRPNRPDSAPQIAEPSGERARARTARARTTRARANPGRRAGLRRGVEGRHHRHPRRAGEHQRHVDGDRPAARTPPRASPPQRRGIRPDQRSRGRGALARGPDEAGADRAGAQAAHQQTEAGGTQPELALADDRQQRPERRAAGAVGQRCAPVAPAPSASAARSAGRSACRPRAVRPAAATADAVPAASAGSPAAISSVLTTQSTKSQAPPSREHEAGERRPDRPRARCRPADQR